MRARVLLVLLNIALFAVPVELYKSYAAEEVAANDEGGQHCRQELADMKARIQKIVDDYNAKDKEIDVWPLTR